MGSIERLMEGKKMRLRKKNIVVGVMIATLIESMIFTGCSPTTHTKEDIPETKYKQAGYAVKGEIEEDGTVKMTYALIGVKNKKITYVYLDQIEQNPHTDRHLFTNKELYTAYGLAYKGNKGEWSEQITALSNYISGNSLTIDEVNDIPVYKKSEREQKVPKKGTDLAAGCALDISDFLDVINEAYDNREDTDAMRLAVGEDIRVNNLEGKLSATIGFVGTNYRYKICYSHLESYTVDVDTDKEIISTKEKAEMDDSIKNIANGEKAFEKYIERLNMVEAYGVETYDPGDGVNTALPKVDSDLAQICNIDLSKYILVLKEIAGRL